MGILDSLFGLLFGRRRRAEPPVRTAPPRTAPRMEAPRAPPPLSPAPQTAPPQFPAPPASHFFDTLVAETTAALTAEDFAASSQRLGCEPAVIRAYFQVETGGRSGFEADGKPTILYEPHIFSQRTQRRFDGSHPNISYPRWDRTRYPRDQAGRWAQMREAFALDPEAAVASASWGAFQVMGFHFQRCGFPTAQAFVADMSKSMARQLAAFEAYVLHDRVLTQAVRDKNWRVMTERYNGAGQIDVYAPRLEAAYRRYSAEA
jgi:hypothetical protein